MAELLIPKPQPSFPREDVNEVNAQIFEQLLLDPEYILNVHELAEQNVIAFKLGHATIKSLGFALYKDPTHRMAFSYGATIYEALSTTVRPAERVSPSAIHIKEKMHTLLELREDSASAIMNILDEEERFVDETPVAADLMTAAADFQPNLDKRLVIWGAALECSIDRDSLERAA